MEKQEFQPDQVNEFIKLLSINQRMIYAYIMSLVANFNDADDVMQETLKTIWEQFNKYEQGTNFLAWSRTIAFYRVKEYRRRNGRQKVFLFDDATLEELQLSNEKDISVTDDYLDALRRCLTKMSQSDQSLVKLKYFHNLTAKQIAGQVQRKTQSIYRSIVRIQQVLIRCINRKVVSEESS